MCLTSSSLTKILIQTLLNLLLYFSFYCGCSERDIKTTTISRKKWKRRKNKSRGSVTKTLENRSLGMVLLQSHVTTQLCNF